MYKTEYNKYINKPTNYTNAFNTNERLMQKDCAMSRKDYKGNYLSKNSIVVGLHWKAVR